MTTEELKIYDELQNNSFVFLKDFIERITSNDNASYDNISKELVMLSVCSLQISLELALKAVVLKKAGLLQLVKTQNAKAAIPHLFTNFEKNALRTKSFEEIKNYAQKNEIVKSLADFDYETVTDFQRYRNGIVHLSYKFQNEDYFDLKYEITYFVVSILIKVLCSGDDDIKPSEFLEYSLGGYYRNKLIKYKPYIDAMERMAKEHSGKVFTCINCSNKSYAQEEKYCYCCNFNGNAHSFRDCEFCSENESMIYDGLNLDLNNFEGRAQCLNCQKDTIIFVCPTCENSYNLEIIPNLNEICCVNECKAIFMA